MVKIVDDILEHIDKRSVVALVSLDISAAFDMVNHNLLLDRPDEEYGINGAAKDWIGSYLSDRQFFVVHARLHPTCAQPLLGSFRDQYFDRRFSLHMSHQSFVS